MISGGGQGTATVCYTRCINELK